jgi:hypothetical protein
LQTGSSIATISYGFKRAKDHATAEPGYPGGFGVRDRRCWKQMRR